MKNENQTGHQLHEKNFLQQQQSQNHPETDYFQNSKCLNGNQGILICSSPKCKNQLIVCADKKCNCRQPHQQKGRYCNFVDPSSTIKAIQHKIIKNTTMTDYFYKKLDDLIEWASIIQDRIKFLGLSENQYEFFNKSKSLKFQEISGKLVYETIKDIHSQNTKFNTAQQIQLQIQRYWQRMSEQIHSKVIFFNSFNQTEKMPNENKFKTSKIIQSHIQSYQVEELLDGRKLQNCQLIYRASDYNFDVKYFEKLSKNRVNTILLVKTEHNKIFGYFNTEKWKLSSERQTKSQSFIFSLSNNQKYEFNDQIEQQQYDPYNNYPMGMPRPYTISQPTINDNVMKGSIYGPRIKISSKNDVQGFGICNNAHRQKDSYILIRKRKNQLNPMMMGGPYPQPPRPINPNLAISRNVEDCCLQFTGERDIYFKVVEWELFSVQFKGQQSQKFKEKEVPIYQKKEIQRESYDEPVTPPYYNRSIDRENAPRRGQRRRQ